MTAVAKVGTLLAVVLLGIAATATSAQAVSWNPDNTVVSGTAEDPTLSYSVVTVVCATSTLDTLTGTDSATLDDVVIDVQGPCTVSGEDATVDCGSGSSTMDLIAQMDASPGGWGAVVLGVDFFCVVTTDLCTLTFAGPQSDGGFVLDEENDTLRIEFDVDVTRSGSFLCGPAQGTGSFSGLYQVTPASLTIDP